METKKEIAIKITKQLSSDNEIDGNHWHVKNLLKICNKSELLAILFQLEEA